MLLLTAGCHNVQNGKAPVNDKLSANEQAEGEKRILTIAVYDDYYKLDLVIDRFTALHPDVSVEVDNYHGDEEKYKLQVTTQLLAGKAPDIMDAWLSAEEKLSDSGLLADIYPLLRNDPAFHENEYFMNVIDAMAYKGKLIVFPVSWSYRMIGVNNMFSGELVERFSGYETISYRQLFDLYNSLEDKSGRNLSGNIDIITAVAENINDYIDSANKKCYFNTPEFIEFITGAKNCTPSRKAADGELGWWFGPKIYRADQEQYAKQYCFAEAPSNIPFFDFPCLEKEVFTYYIPLVSAQGKIFQMVGRRYCINGASKNQGLAWEFIKFLTTPEANEYIYQPSFSVNRELYRTSVSANIVEFIDDWRKIAGNTIVGDTEEIVGQVMAKLAPYNDMPMENNQFWHFDIIRDLLTSYYNGFITAEQAASELQNKVSLILQE